MPTRVSPGSNLKSAIQNASQGETIIAESGTHRHKNIYMRTPGVTLKMAEGARLTNPDMTRGENILNIQADNITVTGPGEIWGDRNRNTPDSQFENVIDVRGESLSNRVQNTRLDGLTVGNAPGGDSLLCIWCEGLTITNCTITRGYRNSFSVISAKDLLAQQSKFTEAFGRKPGDGVDLEPSGPNQALDNCVFQNCSFNNNLNEGFRPSTHNLQQDDPISIDVINCEAVQNGQQGFWTTPARFSDQIRIGGCYAAKNGSHGFHLGGPNNYLYNCLAENNGDAGYLVWGPWVGGQQVGEAVLRGCEARAGNNQQRPAAVERGGNLTLLDFSFDTHPTNSIGGNGNIRYNSVSGNVNGQQIQPGSVQIPPAPEGVDGIPSAGAGVSPPGGEGGVDITNSYFANNANANVHLGPEGTGVRDCVLVQGAGSDGNTDRCVWVVRGEIPVEECTILAQGDDYAIIAANDATVPVEGGNLSGPTDGSVEAGDNVGEDTSTYLPEGVPESAEDAVGRPASTDDGSGDSDESGDGDTSDGSTDDGSSDSGDGTDGSGSGGSDA